jgi:hypothetical protein
LFNSWSANASNSSVTSYTYFEYATDSGYSPDQPYSVTGRMGKRSISGMMPTIISLPVGHYGMALRLVPIPTSGY